MELEEQTINGLKVLELDGRFDAHTADAVRNWLAENCASGDGNAIVSMKGVNFVDSTALAVLVQGMKRCRETGGELYLCQLQQAARIIFELTRFDKAFTIVEDIDAAVAAAQGVNAVAA